MAKLQIVVEVDSQTGEANLKSTAGAIGKVDKAAQQASGTLQRFFREFQRSPITTLNQGLEAISKALHAFEAIYSKTLGAVVSTGEQLQSLSRQFSIPVEALSKFSFAATQANVPIEGLGFGFKRLSEALIESEKPGSKAAATFKALGVTAKQLEEFKRDPTAAILGLADAFNKFDDGARKSVAAQQLFGRGFFGFLSLFKEGRAEIEKNIEVAQRFGLVLSTDSVNAADRLGDAFKLIGAALRGINFRTFGDAGFLNQLADIAEHVAENIADIGRNIPAESIRQLQDAITELVQVLGNLVEEIARLGVSDAAIGALRDLASVLGDIAEAARVLNQEGISGALDKFARFAFSGTRFSDFFTIPSSIAHPRPPTAEEQVFPGQPPISFAASISGLQPPLPQRLPTRTQPLNLNLDTQKADELNKKLREIGDTLAGLEDPSKALQTQIEATVAELQKMGASKTQIAAAREQLEAIAKLKLGKEFADQLREITAASEELVDPASKVRHELEALAEKARVFAEPMDAAVLDFAKRLEDTRGVIADVAKEVDTVGAAIKEAGGGNGALAAFGQQLADVSDAGNADMRQLQLAIQRLEDPTAAVTQKFDDLIARLQAIGTGEAQGLIGVVQNLKAVAVATEEAKRTAGAYFDLFDAIGRGASDVFDALISGTRSVSDAFEGLKISIIRSLAEAFFEGLKQKAGFEGAVKINLVQFGGNLINAVEGIFTGTGGTNGGGVLGSLFQGVFGPQGLPGTIASAATGIVGGQTVGGGTVGTGISTSGIGGGRIGSPFGGGISTGVNAGSSAISIANAALGAHGVAFTAAQRLTEFGFSAVRAEFGTFEAVKGVVQGIVGNLANLVTVAASLYSIYSSVASVQKQGRAVNQATLGQGGSFKLGSNLGLGLGIAAGGAIGGVAGGAGLGATVGLAGGPIGAVVGAAVGAAIGAAISAAISSAVAGAITKGVSEAVKKGLTQEQLNAKIAGNTGLKIAEVVGGGPLGVLRAVTGKQTFSGSRQSDSFITGLLTAGIGSLLTEIFDLAAKPPNLEKIFDKLFTKAVNSIPDTGVTFNRQLGGARGLGTTAGAIKELQPLAGDARIVSRVIGALIGAGRDNDIRIARFTNILLNSLAAAGKGFDDAQKVIYQIVRGLGGGRLLEGLRVVQTVFPIADRDTAARNPLGVLPGATGGRFKAEDLLVRAFKQEFPDLDIAKIVDIYLQGQFTQAQKALRQSRKAVGGSLPDLFSGTNAAEGIQKFSSDLQGAIRDAFVKGISKAILASPVGDLLTGIFRTLNRELKRLIKDGFSEESLDKFVGKIDKQARLLEALLSSVGLDAFLTRLIETEKRLEEAISNANIRAAVASGDTTGARSQIEARLQPFIDTFKGFQQLGRDLRTRAGAAIAGSGVQGQIERIFALFQASVQARRQLFSTAGVSRVEDLINSPALKNDLPKALELLNQFADARLSELEAELELARQQKDFFTQIKETFQGIRDQIAVIRTGPRATRAIIGRERGEVESLLPKALQGDQDAIARISQLLPQLISQGQSVFAPGSAGFQGLLNFVDTIAQQLGITAGQQADAAAAAIDSLTAQTKDFQTKMQPVIDFYTQLSKQALQTEFDKIVQALGRDGPIGTLLQQIAAAQGLTLPSPTGAGGTTTETTPTGGPNNAGGTTTPGPGGFDTFTPNPVGGTNPFGGTLDRGALLSVIQGYIQQTFQALIGIRGFPQLAPAVAGALQGIPAVRVAVTNLRLAGNALTDLGTYEKVARSTNSLDDIGRLEAALANFSRDIPQREKGGPVHGSMPYMVGEKGPELFVPKASGTILPHGSFELRALGGLVQMRRPYLVGEKGPELFLPHRTAAILPFRTKQGALQPFRPPQGIGTITDPLQGSPFRPAPFTPGQGTITVPLLPSSLRPIIPPRDVGTITNPVQGGVTSGLSAPDKNVVIHLDARVNLQIDGSKHDPREIRREVTKALEERDANLIRELRKVV